MLTNGHKETVTTEVARGCKEAIGAEPSDVTFGDAVGGKVKMTVLIGTAVGDVSAEVTYDETLLVKSTEQSGAAQFVRENTAAALARAIIAAAIQ